jgi:hypothetical protein
MSKTESELPPPLRDVGATELERRLLHAAGREVPSRALAERMASGLCIALPATDVTLASGAKVGAPAAPKAVVTSSSLVPWLSGAVLAAVVAAGYIATRPPRVPAMAPASTAAPSSMPEEGARVVTTPVVELPPRAVDEAGRSAPLPSATPRGRTNAVSGDVTEQIALIDAARDALAHGGAERALTTVRQYQSRFPKGAFRPEAAAIKIEALMKLGRTTEARSLAERFLVAHGPGPLAERVARLAGLRPP